MVHYGDYGKCIHTDEQGRIVKHYILHESCRATVKGKAIVAEGGPFHVCSKHGNVQLLPIYVRKEGQITKEVFLELQYGCPMCAEDKLGTIVEAVYECCVECFRKDNLTECEICGDTVCMKHSISSVCLDCAEKMNRSTTH